jgi:nucleoid DNA-binding protein
MKIEQLIKDIQAEQPKALAGLSEAAAAKLLRTALRVVNKAIADTAEGAVSVPGLGNFKVRQHKSKEEGGEAAGSVRRIHFVPSSTEKRDPEQAKAAKAAKGEAAASPEREAKRAERQAARKTAGKAEKGEGKAGGKRAKAAAANDAE